MKITTAVTAIILSLTTAAASLAMPDMQPAAEAQPAKAAPISGKVLEVLDSGGYTYLLLDVDGFNDWVAIPEMFIKVGEEVELQPGTQMGEFTSKALNKTFKQIIFSGGPTEKFTANRKTSAHKGVNMSEPAPGKKKSEGKVVEGLKVEKAKGDNSYDLAEVFARKAELQNKIITVRGQVVKVTTAVMDKNWVHIKDGTGENGANKLVITTKDTVDTGEVVTFSGVFHNNVDFGGGYEYAVIMEDASKK